LRGVERNRERRPQSGFAILPLIACLGLALALAHRVHHHGVAHHAAAKTAHATHRAHAASASSAAGHAAVGIARFARIRTDESAVAIAAHEAFARGRPRA
jgi:hypothetical protein